MSDLISREAAKEIICGSCICTNPTCCSDYVALMNIPAVDAVPVVHGEWVARDDGILYCSNCRAVKPYDVTDGDSISYWPGDWCRHCGAKMDVGIMQIKSDKKG